jgi:hypothetical protein
MVGMFNLDSVFGENMANGGIRGQDTKGCGMMGISGAARGEGLGLECCLKWAMSANEEGSDSGMGVAGAVSGIALCCALSPNYCLSALDIAKEKAGCLNGALAAGSQMDSAWKTCAVECGKKGYGELVHNIDGTYDPAQIENLMKECYNGAEKNWQPSPTVLTASELAPIVPEEIKGVLSGDVNGSVGSSVEMVQDEIKNLMFASDLPKIDSQAKMYVDNINSVRENQAKMKLNAVTRAIALGQRSVALALNSGEDVDGMRSEIETSNDMINLLKGIAKLQAQHLQKINQITAIRSKLLELNSIDTIISGDIQYQGEDETKENDASEESES